MDKNTEKTTKDDQVMYYFREISKIPRESGNEAAIRQYLIDFATAHSLWHVVDQAGNVIIRKEGSPGKEKIAPIALQGHMDMVCVKDEGYEHDFTRDPLQLQIDGDYLTAKGTTLGADNGIAIAMVLALFSDAEAVHGPLEGVFTVSEETGLGGATDLEIQYIQSRRLINLDSEEEGIFYIGCAGGGEVSGTLTPALTMPSEDEQAWRLTLSGFTGGHSGAEIHTGRGNAILCGVRMLKRLDRTFPIALASMSGGSKHNVIPSTFSCTFTVPKEADATVEALVEEMQQALHDELAVQDPHAAISAVKTELPGQVLTREQSASIIDALYLTPHGVISMSSRLDGLVETSNNLAIVRLDQNSCTFIASQRSSIASARDEIEERTCTAFELSGALTSRENKYPAWTPNPSSPLAEVCAEFYRRHTGKEPVVTAIHAGLECGMINSKAADMDSISFGPDLSGVHSTDERMSISSAARVYEYLLALLEDLSRRAD
ncbi:MAG: aminoacyl-histidine dipeptidase [Spirochaetia bacterium]|nr:aminoacyl-histidine dipeptidase [Spirochaetia bacterium]MCF7940265.1 aminoacyl-histidine dipeptidase [Spirochaetia bacterium]